MHAFQLNGVLTETPVSRREWGECKFGAERWKAVSASLCSKFGAVGIKVNPDGYMSSSHLAHRLTEYAAEVKPEIQLPLSMDLFTLHHVQGTHLSDKIALSNLAVKYGLFADPADALAWLNSKGSDLEVKKAYQRAQRSGITGVPFFVFQDKYAASGAMGVDEFVNVSTACAIFPPCFMPAKNGQEITSRIWWYHAAPAETACSLRGGFGKQAPTRTPPPDPDTVGVRWSGFPDPLSLARARHLHPRKQ